MTRTSPIPFSDPPAPVTLSSPTPPSTSWQQSRARLASLSRLRPEGDPEVLALRREMQRLYAESVVSKVLAESPPFTPEQQDRIRAILSGGGVV